MARRGLTRVAWDTACSRPGRESPVHEMSLAFEICRIAERAAGPERVGQIVEVGVQVGDDAGVEPENLSFCLEVLLRQPPFVNAVPRLLRQPGDVLRVDYLEVDDGRPHD